MAEKLGSSWYNSRLGSFYHVRRTIGFLTGCMARAGQRRAATPSRGKISLAEFSRIGRPMEAGDENGVRAPDPLNPKWCMADL